MKLLSKIILSILLISNCLSLLASHIDTDKNRIINYNNNFIVPSATIFGNASVCQNAASPLITFTGSGGTAPYTFTYKINGGTNLTVITTGTNSSVTVSVNTTVAGTFIYSLVSVHDAANPTPEQPSSGTATVIVSSPPIVDFSFNNNTTCSGTIIQFTSSVTGTGPYTYSWDFGDSTPLSSQVNPTHAFTSLGCGTATFNVVLTITGNGCTITKNHTVSVKQKPDIDFIDVNNPFLPFDNCANASSNPVYSITVGNTSASSCISAFSINWGEGPIQNNVTFPVSHTYNSIGAYTMTITANGINGCVNSKTYIVKNVSNPLGGLNSPGSTQNLCAPTTNLQFSISNWGSNSLDTTYNINYGDGTPMVVLTQNLLVSSSYYNSANPSTSANYPIPHIYTTSNCPASSFQLTLDVTNACGTTPFTLGNITILTKPAANFTVPPIACINSSVLFTNTTISGYSQGCIQGSIYTWDFGDGSPIVTTPLSPPQNINHTYTSPGTYTVILTAQNFCGITSIPHQICIESPLIPQFTLNNNTGCTPLAVTTNNTTNLANSCPGNPTYLWNVTYASGLCGSGTPVWNYTNGTSATSSSPSFNFVTSGTYNISLSTTNSCGTVTSPIQAVTVKKPPTITSINGILASYCGPTTINPTATINSCAPATSTLTYAWSFPGGIPATSTLTAPGAITYTTAGNYTVSLTITNECGSSTTTNQLFTINSVPVVTTTPLTQTICSGSQTTLVNLTSNLPGTTFTWTATATSGISGFTTSGTNTIPVQTITTTSTSPGTITYTITPSLGGCIGAATNYIITVNPAPTITSQPTSSTVCQGGVPTVLSVTVSGATGTLLYQWYSNISNNTTTGTVISGATNATYSPPSTNAGTLYYYCVISLPTGGCSSIKTNTATVTILPNATINLQPITTQNLCTGVTISSPLSISYTGGTGTPTYQWYSNTTNSNTGGTIITGATNASYTPPIFTAPGTYYYYAIVSLNGNGCLPAVSNVAEIIVFADPTITVQPIISQTLCQGAIPLNLQVTATGGNGTFSYQWYSNSTNSNTGGTIITGSTTNSYTPPTTVVGTKYYYCVVTQSSTTGCSVTSATATIIVIAAPTITSQPISSTICLGGTPTGLSVTYVNGVGMPTYQWFSNTVNSNSGGTPISGATSSTYSPPNTPVGIIYYYCVITLPSTGGCSSITSNTAEVIINTGTTITLQPTPTQSLCVGTTILTPLTITYSGGTGTASYQWYSNTTNSNTGGTLIPGATSSSFTPAVFTTTGNFYYYVVVTLSGNGCGPIPSDVAEIIIVADPIITSQPLPSQTICQNVTPSSLSVSASGGIGTSYFYQWYNNAVNNTTSGTLIPGETNSIFIPPTTNVGTTYYYCGITQTNGSGCNVTSTVAVVIVNLAPIITTQPISSTICIGQTPTLLSVGYTNGVGTPQYQWYSNTTNSTTGSLLITGETNANYNPPNNVAGTTYYYCVITFSSGGCSNITSNIAVVIVNQNPIIASENSIICSGNSFTVIPSNTNGNIVPVGTTYIWINPNITPSGSITGASAQPIPQTTISQTLINTTTSPATVVYTVTPISGNCVGANFTITVTVNPAINPNVVAINNTCFGVNTASITTNITGGIPPYSISWIGPNGFTSSLTSISNLLPGNYDLTINDMGNCPFTNTYTITEPTDILITLDTENDITCFSSSNGSINLTVTGGTGNYFYTWTKDNNPFAITEDISNLAPGIYTISVTDSNSCGPKTATFTITEPPLLVVTLVSQINVLCFGAATGAITINTTGGTPIQISPGVYDYTYSWTGPNAFTSNSQNLTNIQAGTYNLVVTDDLGCTKNLVVTLTQSAEIIIIATTTPITCYGANNASITTTITGGNPPYQIAWSNLAVGLDQTNLAAGDYTITVTDAVGCQKALTINIPEAPIFTVTPIVTNISCYGAHDGSIVLNLVGGIPPVVLVWGDGSPSGTTRNNLGPGTYSVTISDGTPCYINRTFIIVEPQALVLMANTVQPLDCNNANSGAINLLVSGGTPPFAYLWSNGATTEDLNAIAAGNYLVTVTDANGCTKQEQYILTRPSPIIITVDTETISDCANHKAEQYFNAMTTGGVPPYQFVWSSGTVSGTNNQTMTTTEDGLVILQATDAIGCSSTYTLDVIIPEIGYPSFETISIGYSTYGVYSIGDPIQFTNTATGDYISISWNFGDGTFSTETNPVHTYINPKDYVVTQTVTYPFGCVYVHTITLIVEKGYVFVLPTGFTPNSDNINDTFRPVTKALKNVQLKVYDTWGAVIYSEEGDVLKGWDGKINGVDAENGNYYCTVSAETFYGTILNESTPFTLIK